MAVPSVNLTIDKGTTFSTSLKLKLDGASVNLQNSSFSSKMKKHYSSTTSYPLSVTIVDSSNGIIRVGLASTASSIIPEGRYLYDVLYTNTNTLSTVKVVEGFVIVRGTAS